MDEHKMENKSPKENVTSEFDISEIKTEIKMIKEQNISTKPNGRQTKSPENNEVSLNERVKSENNSEVKNMISLVKYDDELIEEKVGVQRENRLTSIIDQLRYANKKKTEHALDFSSFLLLSAEDIKELIPVIGHMALFNAQIKTLRDVSNNETTVITVPADHSQVAPSGSSHEYESNLSMLINDLPLIVQEPNNNFQESQQDQEDNCNCGGLCSNPSLHREEANTQLVGFVRGEISTFKTDNGEPGAVGSVRAGAGGGVGRGRTCDVSPPPPAPTLPAPHNSVKQERLSPHDNRSTGSRSRSVTPSTSSYPGTPPERGSPHGAAPPAPAPPPHHPRNYSDIMRSLAARYNSQHNNDYFHRVNGFGGVESSRPASQISPVRADVADAPLGGLFTRLARQQGGPQRLPAFPAMLDMSSTKTLLAIARVSRGGRSRRKRTGAAVNSNAEHSPLDLSAASEHAAKRARLSVSPSTRSDSDERDRTSGDDRSEPRGECLCAEARARLSAWTVDDVCDFVNSIDICAEYSSNFREQSIDGAGLPLLTEDHLTGMLQMKLGPALKLRAVLARRLEPCATCQINGANSQNSNMATAIPPKMNGSSLKSEPRSNTTSPS